MIHGTHLIAAVHFTLIKTYPFVTILLNHSAWNSGPPSGQPPLLILLWWVLITEHSLAPNPSPSHRLAYMLLLSKVLQLQCAGCYLGKPLGLPFPQATDLGPPELRPKRKHKDLGLQPINRSTPTTPAGRKSLRGQGRFLCELVGSAIR